MKKIFTFLIACLAITTLSAQNFMKFDATDNNGVKALTGLTHLTGKSTVDIIVPENFNLTNVTVDWAVAATDEVLTTPFPTDFSTPQIISVKGVSSTKNWTVTFRKINSASLPLSLVFSTDNMTNAWTPATIGWAGASIDPADNNAKVVRFGIAASSFVIGFSDAPAELSYKIFMVGADPFEGQFDVLTSTDGVDWVSKTKFDSENPMAVSNLTEYNTSLETDVRFVKWVYTTRPGSRNVTMNNISVTKSTVSIIDNTQDEVVNMYVNNGELVISDGNVLKVEVYNTVGAQTMMVNNPSNSVDLSALPSGVYVAKATNTDGKASVVKFIK